MAAPPSMPPPSMPSPPMAPFAIYDWCGTTSIYLAFMSPNTYYTSEGELVSTVPYLTSPDPQQSLFRVLVPSILLPVTLMMFFLGRKYFWPVFSLAAAGVGSAVAYGIVYSRPDFIPIETQCGVQWAATAGGAALGLIIGIFVIRFLPKFAALFVGGFLSFAVFQQFPQLDLLVTGFPIVDQYNTLFLGWGLWPMWAVTLICAFVSLVIFCFGVLEYWRKVLFIAVSGGWAITHSIRLIARNQTDYHDGIATGWSAAILAIAMLALVILQPVFDMVSPFKEARPSSVLPTRANTVRMVGR